MTEEKLEYKRKKGMEYEESQGKGISKLIDYFVILPDDPFEKVGPAHCLHAYLHSPGVSLSNT
jgi:hypothetical protein